MDFLKQIFSFKDEVKFELCKKENEASHATADSEFLLKTILGFVSQHYSQILLLSSGFSIIFTIYSVILAIKFLCRGRKFRTGSSEYYELLKKVHSAAQSENHEENRSCKSILKKYPEMMNSPLKPFDFTPFLRACYTANLDLVRFMIKRGADIRKLTTLGDNGFFLAAYTMSKKQLEDWDSGILEALQGAGFEINQQNGKGHTALHVAAKAGHVLLTRWLLNHGANPNVGNAPHPLELAQNFDDKNHRQVANLLEKYSNKPIKGAQETDEVTEGLCGRQLPPFIFQSDFLN